MQVGSSGRFVTSAVPSARWKSFRIGLAVLSILLVAQESGCMPFPRQLRAILTPRRRIAARELLLNRLEMLLRTEALLLPLCKLHL